MLGYGVGKLLRSYDEVSDRDYGCIGEEVLDMLNDMGCLSWRDDESIRFVEGDGEMIEWMEDMMS